MLSPPGKPTQEILNGFGVFEDSVLLSGGQGINYRAGNMVFKPVADSRGASFEADIYSKIITNDKFRVLRPIRAEDGSWVFKGWTAYEFISGKHILGKYAESIEIGREFHKALSVFPKPDFWGNGTNVWSIADKMAWGEIPFHDFELSNEPLKKIFALLEGNRLPNQLMHGDYGPGNILFEDKLPPAVIDFSPYWRPADFSIAVMMLDAIVWEGLDAIVWEGVDESIFELGKDVKDFKQLLLRGIIRRTCEYIGHQLHPENTKDRTDGIVKYLSLLDLVMKIK